MKTQYEAMKQAYEKFMIERDVPQVVKMLVLNQADNINHLISVYNDNEYEHERDVSKTETENMNSFLNYVDDVDCGGVSEYHIHAMNDMGLE